MTIHDAINEYLKQCEARKLSWSTLKAYRCDLEILDRSQRHTELLDIESEELQKIRCRFQKLRLMRLLP